jgi:hypothetical protein
MAQETIEETFAKGRAVLGDNQDQNRTRISDTETPAETLARARKTTPQPSLQVSANSLTNPPKAPVLTPPAIETPPPTGTADAVSKDLTEIISAQTQEAADLKKRRQEFAELGELGTLSDFRTEQLEEFGVPESTRQLKDIQLQLADIDTASDLTKTRIEGAAGQTVRGAQREVTQEDRENAVRRSGLAAKASVIQGNIETATSLVDQAVTTTYQDRTLKNNNLLNQINDLSGTVDEQTQQLLDAEKARVEADQAAVQEVKDAVSLAMQSGAATPQEVSQLTDINATDASRLALAQSISARGATEERGLGIQAKNASIRASNAGAALNEQKLLDIEAKEKAITDAVESGQIILTPDQADRAAKVAKEFEAEAGEFKKSVAAYNRIIASAEDPSAAGDVAVVFNYMKMLDPGSVVRESEFALAASTGSLDEAIKNKFGKIATGEILEFTRDDFVDRAGKIYFGQLDQQIELEDRFRKQAVDLFGLPENSAELIVQDIRSTGSVSDASFNLLLDTADTSQLQELQSFGLLPNSTAQQQ